MIYRWFLDLWLIFMADSWISGWFVDLLWLICRFLMISVWFPDDLWKMISGWFVGDLQILVWFPDDLWMISGRFTDFWLISGWIVDLWLIHGWLTDKDPWHHPWIVPFLNSSNTSGVDGFSKDVQAMDDIPRHVHLVAWFLASRG